MNGARCLALVGPRCAGKSTLARVAAARFGLPALDLDELLLAERAFDEAATGADSAGALLAAVGEPAFRARESAALARLVDAASPCVLATGGGAVVAPANRALLRERFLVAFLDAPAAVLAARLRADPAPRPSLTGADPAEELERVLAERRSSYEEVADLTLDAAASPPALAAALLAAVRQRDDGSFVRADPSTA